MNYVRVEQSLPSYLVPLFTGDVITLLVQIFGACLVLGIVLYSLRKMARQKAESNRIYAILEVKPTTKTLQSPLSTKELFTVLHALEKDFTVTEKLLGIRRILSCEIVSDKDHGIRYILAVPEKSVGFVKKTLYAYLQGIEVKETEDYVSSLLTQSNPQKTQTKNLVLSKPFAIPLATQENLNQHDPIAYLTGQMTKMRSGDMAGIQIVCTPVLTHSHRGVLSEVKSLQESLMKGEDIRQALYKGRLHSIYTALSMFFNGKPKKDPSSTSRNDLFNSVSDKLGQPLFEVTIRLFSTSQNQTESSARLNGIASSFDTFASQYQSLKEKNSLHTSRSIKNIKNRTLSESDNTLLSSAELAAVYHLPFTATTKTEDMVKVRSRKLPSPLPLKNSSHNQDAVFGRNVYGDESTPISLTLDERRRHMYIIGATGTGKTTALLHMIHNDLENGKGLAVVDPHGDLTQRLLGVIPKERIKDVVYFNPYDIEQPVAINILELPKNLDEAQLQREKDLIASSLISIFHKLYPARYSGPRMEHILRNAVLTALELENPTLMTVYTLLTDIKFRKKVTHMLSDTVLRDFWKNEFGKLGSYQKAEQISPITNKLGRFLTTAMTRNILSQEKSKLDFEDILNNKKILLCDLSKGKIGEDTSAFLGSLIVTKIQLAAFRRVHESEKTRPDFFLYIDEFQNFATPAFAQILSEARKYRLNAILAHQTMSQIENRDILRIILANVGSIVSFRTSNPSDEDMILPIFAPEVEKHEISNLPLYNFYMKINAVESMEAFTGEIDDFVVKDDEEIRNAVIEKSREQYGTQIRIDNRDYSNNSETVKKMHRTVI